MLIGELRAFERTIGAGGHTAFEGKGKYDDLVIAAALVAWWAGHVPAGRTRRCPQEPAGGALRGWLVVQGLGTGQWASGTR